MLKFDSSQNSLANFNRYYCCFGSSQNLHFAHRVQLNSPACKQSASVFIANVLNVLLNFKEAAKPLFLIFRVLHTVQFSRFFVVASAATFIVYQKFLLLSTLLFLQIHVFVKFF